MALPSSVGKWLALGVLFVGEGLGIYAEMVAARVPGGLSGVLTAELLPALLLVTLAGGFLIAGYWLGYKAFENIWIVTAASITSILLIEPVLAWTLFHEAPSRGALVGFIFGALGLAATLFL